MRLTCQSSKKIIDERDQAALNLWVGFYISYETSQMSLKQHYLKQKIHMVKKNSIQILRHVCRVMISMLTRGTCYLTSRVTSLFTRLVTSYERSCHLPLPVSRIVT